MHIYGFHKPLVTMEPLFRILRSFSLVQPFVSFLFFSNLPRMGWTALHTAARDGDMKRLTRCVTGIKWLVSYP